MSKSTISYRDAILPVLNFIGWVSLCIINFLSSIGKINNRTPQDITALYVSTEFVPGPGAFIVMWGSILLFFGIFVFWQLHPSNWKNYFVTELIGYLWFFGYCIPQVGWFFCYHWNRLWPSVFVQLWLFSVSLALYIRVGCDFTIYTRSRLLDASKNIRMSFFECWFVQMPFSLLYGWLFLSLLANILVAVASKKTAVERTEWMASYEWSMESVFLQTLSSVGAVTLLFLRNDIFFASAVTWGFWCIAYRHTDNPVVLTGALVNVGLLGFCTLGTISYMLGQIYRMDIYIPTLKRRLARTPHEKV